MNRDNRTTNHEGRAKMYKSNGLNNEELRRKRRDDEVQIRKQKRMDLFENRRNISDMGTSEINQVDPFLVNYVQLLKDGSVDELVAITNIAEHLQSGKYELQDIATCKVLTLVSDVYQRKRQQAREFAQFFQIAAAEMSRSSSPDNICIESLCHILINNDESIPIMMDAVQAISIFVGINAVYRNIAFDNAIVPALLTAFEKKDDNLNRSIMWLVSQLFHKLYEYSPAVEEVLPLLELVAIGMQNLDPSTQTDAIRACALMAEWPAIWKDMHETNLLPLLVSSLTVGVGMAKPAVLRAIDFITQTTSDFTEEMFNAGLLEALKPLISARFLSKDVCFILANISAEGEHITDRLISSGVLREIARVMETAEYNTRKEAAFTMCHCCSSSSRAHIAYILEIGMLAAFTDLLTCMDAALVCFILDAIECLLLYGEINLSPDYTNPVSVQLEEIGCKQKLEFLTHSQNIDIHIKSYAILERFFDDDEIVQYNTCWEEMRTTVDQTIDSIVNTVVATDKS